MRSRATVSWPGTRKALWTASRTPSSRRRCLRSRLSREVILYSSRDSSLHLTSRNRSLKRKSRWQLGPKICRLFQNSNVKTRHQDKARRFISVRSHPDKSKGLKKEEMHRLQLINKRRKVGPCLGATKNIKNLTNSLSQAGSNPHKQTKLFRGFH